MLPELGYTIALWGVSVASMFHDENSLKKLTWWSWYYQTISYTLFFGSKSLRRNNPQTTKALLGVTSNMVNLVSFAFLYILTKNPSILYAEESKWVFYANWVVHYMPTNTLLYFALRHRKFLSTVKTKGTTRKKSRAVFLSLILAYIFYMEGTSIIPILKNEKRSNILETYGVYGDDEKIIKNTKHFGALGVAMVIAIMSTKNVEATLKRR